MIRHPALFVLLILTAATPALSAERLVLENGVTVIHDRRPIAPAMSLSVYVRAGLINESRDMQGASHFVEHMMFRATGRRPDGGSEREVWRIGAQMNAYTHEDYTEYSILAPSDRFPLALDILSDALIGAQFRPAQVEEERAVILEEIRKRAGDPEVSAFDDLQTLRYAPHPYGGRLAGTEETIGAMSRDVLHRYYLGTYRPERTIVVLVGDFDPKSALPAIRRTFGAWEPPGTAVADPPPLPREFGHYQELTLNRAGASPTLLLGLSAPDYLHPDYLASRFLRELMVGWLVRRLVNEKRVAIAVDTFQSPFLQGHRLRIRLNLASANDAARARDELLKLLAEFSSPDFAFDDIEQIAANYQAREILLTEDLAALAPVIGRSSLFGYYHNDGYPEHLAAADRYTRITAADLRRVAKQWLCPENMRVLFLLPKGAKAPPAAVIETAEIAALRPKHPAPHRIPAEEGPAAAAAAGRPPGDSEATRTVLSNGCRLIHLERSGAPVVSGAIVLPAGSRFDPKGKEGLAALTMKALSLETAGDEAGDSRWTLYALGNAHAYTVGRDTARLTFTVPKHQLRRAIRLFSKILLNPAFTEQAIEEARGRLITDARRSAERVHSAAGAAFREAVFGDAPYAHDHRGTVASLEAITREDIVRFYRTHYHSSQAVVAIVGESAPRTARRLVESHFANEEGPVRNVPPVPAQPAPARAQIKLEHPSGRSYLIVGSNAPAAVDPGRGRTDLLRLALGWQVFHHFTDVVSTAYSAGSFYDVFATSGAFGLYVSTSPARAAKTRTALYGILDRARSRGLPETLLKDARGAWLGGFALASVKSLNIATRLARNEAIGAGFDRKEKTRRQIEGITAAELSRACRRLLRPEHLVEIRVN